MKTRMPGNEVKRIREMLSYRRPARSKTESEFISRYIDNVPDIYQDEYGNRLLLESDSKVIISCHTDSVHHIPGKQVLNVSHQNIMSLHKHEHVSNCLGADDAAGVYAALRMIEAGVKVNYIFHRDEESGGRGSAWLAQEYSEWLSTFDICLALDRRGTNDVIVSQSWGMSASEEFSKGLALQLGMEHKAADGIFTDSANYVDLIPECSNLSIGYQHEHTTRETLDLNYLERVIGALVSVDWTKVPVAREPGQEWPEIEFEDERELRDADVPDWLYSGKWSRTQ